QAAPSPMKRRSRLSTWAAMSMVGRPSTWLRKPFSAYSGENTMPERPVRRLSVTSSALLPMGETIPSPVMTTRRMMRPSFGSALGKSDLHVLDLIDKLAIGLDRAVGNAHGQPAGLHGLGEI